MPIRTWGRAVRVLVQHRASARAAWRWLVAALWLVTLCDFCYPGKGCRRITGWSHSRLAGVDRRRSVAAQGW